MAIAVRKRRIVTTMMETTRGAFNAPTASADALPRIREATFAITPISVDRPTLRLSLTKFPNTYPGVATVQLTYLVELGGDVDNPKADYDVPNWSDLFRCCGFEEVSNVNGGLKPRLLQNVTGPMTGTDAAGAPLRHGSTVTGNGVSPGGTGTVLGDYFDQDDVLCVQETTAPGTNPSPFTWTQTINSLTRIASGTRSANSVVAWRLRSDVNLTETISSEVYLDGKRLQVKGIMGTVEILLNHGDMVLGQFTLSGVHNAYADVTIPTNAFESQKVAPTFLGKEVRFWETNAGATPKGYGRDAATFPQDPQTPDRSVIGAINSINISTGNQVVLRENSFDPSGVSFALITDREPAITFNPDEVLDTEFPWVAKFIAGAPIRFKAMVGAAGTVTTQDGNTIDILAPGIVASQLGDIERDGINAWDGRALLTGGDYDTSASGELPGNDNELTLIYR